MGPVLKTIIISITKKPEAKEMQNHGKIFAYQKVLSIAMVILLVVMPIQIEYQAIVKGPRHQLMVPRTSERIC